MICKTCTHSKIGHWAQLKQILTKVGVNISQPLYHGTTFTKAQSIISGGFKALAKEYKPSQDDDAFQNNAVCFTRNLEFAKGSTFGASPSYVTFILDANDLKHHYKLYSYDWMEQNNAYREEYTDEEDGGYIRKNPDKFEYEERVSRTPMTSENVSRLNSADDLCLIETVIPARYIKAALLKYEYYTPAIEGKLGNIPIILKVGNTYVLPDDDSITELYHNYKGKAVGNNRFLLTILGVGEATPLEIQQKLAIESDEDTKGRMASFTDTHPTVLKILSKDPSFKIRSLIAENREAPVDILKRYATEGEPALRLLMAKSWYLQPEISKILSRDPDAKIRKEVVKTIEKIEQNKRGYR